MIVNTKLFPVSRGFSTITDMRKSMDDLQVQLATGKRASSLSQLGNDRLYDLAIRGRQSLISGYQDTSKTVDLRLEFLNNSVSRLDEIEADARSNASSGGAGDDGVGIYQAQSLASAQLDEVLSILSSDLNGRYMFGGSSTDKNPVASLDAILNGSGGRDGFKTIVSQRKQADAGPDGKGRLTLATQPAVATTNFGGAVDGTELLSDPEIGIANGQTLTLSGGGFGAVNIAFDNASGNTTGSPLDITVATVDDLVAEINSQAGANIASIKNGEIVITAQDSVSSITTGGTAATGLADADPVPRNVVLSEDGDHPFGLKLNTVSTTSAGVTLTQPAGSAPKSLSVDFTGTVGNGDEISIGFTLPDGSTKTVKFTATTSTTPGERQFQIGATPEETAANFQGALDAELVSIGKSDLAAASVYAAADNFFTGQGETALRIDGPPYDTATSYVAATDANTVKWYTGEDSLNARQTVKARVDDGTVVNYGVQANEGGIVAMVRSLAAMTVESYDSSNSDDVDRYNAMRSRQYQRLASSNNAQKGSIETIGLDIGIAKSTIGQATDRQKTYSAQLDTMLSDIEDAPMEEVAMKLLNLQTRLQASYQTTAMISQLTLVNYVS